MPALLLGCSWRTIQCILKSVLLLFSLSLAKTQPSVIILKQGDSKAIKALPLGGEISKGARAKIGSPIVYLESATECVIR